MSDNIWNKVIKTITPLKGRKKLFFKKSKEEFVEEEENLEDIEPEIEEKAIIQKTEAKTSYHKLLVNDSKGVDNNLAKKLKDGKVKIEAKLDLHGYGIDEALGVLLNFISNSYTQNKRCVLVITGKGLRSSSDITLNNRLPIWLNLPDLRAKILMFSHATAKHGGSGAYYVLLKKNR